MTLDTTLLGQKWRRMILVCNLRLYFVNDGLPEVRFLEKDVKNSLHLSLHQFSTPDFKLKQK